MENYLNGLCFIVVSYKWILLISLRMDYFHYNDVIMGALTSYITSLTIVYSIVYSDTDQRKHQSSASLAFVWGIHRGPVNSQHKWPVTRKMFPFDDVIMSPALPANTREGLLANIQWMNNMNLQRTAIMTKQDQVKLGNKWMNSVNNISSKQENYWWP